MHGTLRGTWKASSYLNVRSLKTSVMNQRNLRIFNTLPFVACKPSWPWLTSSPHQNFVIHWVWKEFLARVQIDKLLTVIASHSWFLTLFEGPITEDKHLLKPKSFLSFESFLLSGMDTNRFSNYSRTLVIQIIASFECIHLKATRITPVLVHHFGNDMHATLMANARIDWVLKITRIGWDFFKSIEWIIVAPCSRTLLHRTTSKCL